MTYTDYLMEFRRSADVAGDALADRIPAFRKRDERPGDLVVVRGPQRRAGTQVFEIGQIVQDGLVDARRDRGAHSTQQLFKLDFTHVRLFVLARTVAERIWAPVAGIAKIVSIARLGAQRASALERSLTRHLEPALPLKRRSAHNRQGYSPVSAQADKVRKAGGVSASRMARQACCRPGIWFNPVAIGNNY